jgi:hypothetical protein
LEAALEARDAEITRLTVADREATSEALTDARREIAELKSQRLAARVGRAPSRRNTPPHAPLGVDRAASAASGTTRTTIGTTDAVDRRRIRELEQMISALRVGMEGTKADIDRAASSKAWRYGHLAMRSIRLLTLRRDRTEGALTRALLRIERTESEYLALPEPDAGTDSVRRRTLEGTATSLSATLQTIKLDIQRAADSRAWRYGHGATRLARRITFRRSQTKGALARALERIEQVEQATLALPAGQADASRTTTPLPAPDAEVVDLDAIGVDLRRRLGPLPDGVCPAVSIVLVVRRDAPGDPGRIDRLRAATDHPDLEIIPVEGDVDLSAAVTSGVDQASNDLLLILDSAAEPLERGWLREMIARRNGGIVGATLVDVSSSGDLVVSGPLTPTVSPSGVVRIEAVESGPLFGPRFGDDRVCTAVPTDCVLVSRTSLAARGGFAGGYRGFGLAADLCLSTADTGVNCVVAGRSVVVRRARPAVDAVDHRVLQERWGPRLLRAAEREPRPAHAAPTQSPAGIHQGTAPSRPSMVVGPRSERFGIRIAGNDLMSAERGGDLHVASALARALRHRGHATRIDARDTWSSAAGHGDDVVVHLRGRGRAFPRPAPFNVLWCISHPDDLSPAECDGYDLVCVASTVFANTVRERTRTPVAVLEQATDPDVFYPPAGGGRARELVYVANSRGVGRRVVQDLLPMTEHRLEVWGEGWAGTPAGKHVIAEHVPNRQLREVYGSARVVLADHWDDMREHGFVSNRIYDALACGTPVITDDVAGLRGRFPGAVHVYRTGSDLRETIRNVLSLKPEELVRSVERARRQVLEEDTFDRRADRLIELIDRYRSETREHEVSRRGSRAGSPQ